VILILIYAILRENHQLSLMVNYTCLLAVHMYNATTSLDDEDYRYDTANEHQAATRNVGDAPAHACKSRQS